MKAHGGNLIANVQCTKKSLEKKRGVSTVENVKFTLKEQVYNSPINLVYSYTRSINILVLD